MPDLLKMSIIVREPLSSENVDIAELRDSARAEAERYRGHIIPVDGQVSNAVALIEDQVVGVVSFVDARPVRTITLLHVHPQARGVGVGDALIEWLLTDARTCGFTTVRATALPGDRATKNLLERNGLVASAIQVEKILD